ncbi:hypothetical protein JAAARDRAFT_406999 [Jaapia argillacea MUCL 33604]|uniref:Uncharacterized protein n=1 Tax=Jaapia argillacea MUCL 33604 TaxID=933084 RepID=A0A067PHW9_9AGAM|nr:hypothetical protein JAAARDRAFT_406999 [Jaapia argillacea MUCL 33604]
MLAEDRERKASNKRHWRSYVLAQMGNVRLGLWERSEKLLYNQNRPVNRRTNRLPAGHLHYAQATLLVIVVGFLRVSRQQCQTFLQCRRCSGSEFRETSRVCSMCAILTSPSIQKEVRYV